LTFRPARAILFDVIRAFSGIACVAVSVTPLLTQMPAFADGASATVGLHPASEVVAEGERVAIRVERDSDLGNLGVVLELGGDATLDRDYDLTGHEGVEDARARVVIPDGQVFAEVALEVADDASAEADETVVLEISEDPAYRVDDAARKASLSIGQNDFTVTTTDDSGEGSLRQAILNANALEGPDTVVFDAAEGPFAEPQTIVLASPLPELLDGLTIDGYIDGHLWKAVGVTISGKDEHPVLRVARGAGVSVQSLTVAQGRAEQGGGIANEGRLVVKGVTFLENRAARRGGAVANLGGTLTAINSTFVDNHAGKGGGGLASIGGSATVTNCTFSENEAPRGGALFNRGKLLLRNTILANSVGRGDCDSRGSIDGASTHNLIESNRGCGTPILSEDPSLEALGYYNGPAKTYALRGDSPAINLGDNASAVDENGAPLVWDQRGNGDPRYVSGFTDLGAFERQAHAVLTVDTLEDNGLRACTRPGKADCPLRGAIELANAEEFYDAVRFDPQVFATPQTITLTRPLPEITADVTFDATETGDVTLAADGTFEVLRASGGAKVSLRGVRVKDASPSPAPADGLDTERQN
jgi:hypothetical protein